MKDHPERKGRLQLIESMFAGHSWQEALAQSQLHVSRATAYRLRQLARDDEQAERAFLDKLTEPVQAWISEFCTTHPQIASRRVQSELQSRFDVAVSVSQINRIRAKLGVSNPWRGRAQVPVKKN
jgi:transposase